MRKSDDKRIHYSVIEWGQESNFRVPDSESTPRAWIADIPK